MKGSNFCEFNIFFLMKDQKGQQCDLFSQPPLLMFTKGANIRGGHYIFNLKKIYKKEGIMRGKNFNKM